MMCETKYSKISFHTSMAVYLQAVGRPLEFLTLRLTPDEKRKCNNSQKTLNQMMRLVPLVFVRIGYR